MPALHCLHCLPARVRAPGASGSGSSGFRGWVAGSMSQRSVGVEADPPGAEEGYTHRRFEDCVFRIVHKLNYR